MNESEYEKSREDPSRRSLYAFSGVTMLAIAFVMFAFFITQDHGMDEKSVSDFAMNNPDDSSPMPLHSFGVTKTMTRVGAPQTSAYHPSMPLKNQVATLVRAADVGEANAACVLSAALDLCARYHAGHFMDRYPDAYLASMSEEQAEQFVMATSYREERVEAMCAGIDENQIAESKAWIVQSALAGYQSSMSRFVEPARGQDLGKSRDDQRVAIAYRVNAERMLNRAADAGSIEAIRAISIAYATGEIASPLGVVSIRSDELKALAASNALMMIRERAKMDKMPFDASDYSELESSIRSQMAAMDRHDLSRFSKLSSIYFNAYEARLEKDPDKFGVLADLPENACGVDSMLVTN